jgi:hypothetical protein
MEFDFDFGEAGGFSQQFQLKPGSFGSVGEDAGGPRGFADFFHRLPTRLLLFVYLRSKVSQQTVSALDDLGFVFVEVHVEQLRLGKGVESAWCREWLRRRA